MGGEEKSGSQHLLHTLPFPPLLPRREFKNTKKEKEIYQILITSDQF